MRAHAANVAVCHEPFEESLLLGDECSSHRAARPKLRHVRVGPLPSLANLGPEKRLMLAVLDDAIAVLEAFAASGGRRRRRLAIEVEEWIAEEDVLWPFSFVNVCEELGLDVECVRARLSPILATRALGRWRRADVAAWSPDVESDEQGWMHWTHREGA